LLSSNRLWCFGPEQERLGNLAEPEHGFGSRGRAEDSAIPFPEPTVGILREQMEFPDVPTLGFLAYAEAKVLHHTPPGLGARVGTTRASRLP
jgi:hypothetical protein